MKVMKIFKTALVYTCLTLLISAAFLFAGCSRNSSTQQGGTEGGNSDTDTDIVEIPYGGNEVITSAYEKRSYGQNAETDFTALYEDTSSSVVSVKVTYSTRGFYQRRLTHTGSGFFVTDDGYIITSTSLFVSNGLLLDESQMSIEVKTSDGTTYTGDLIYCDSTAVEVPAFAGNVVTLDNSNLSLIKISAEDGTLFNAVTIGNSEAVQYGEDCYTIATFSDEDDDLEWLISEGVVSRPVSDRESNFTLSANTNFYDGSFEYLMQTSLATNDGNEGAPVFNADGHVIGVMNLEAEETVMFQNNASFGISFAVPSQTIQSFLTETAGAVQDISVSPSYVDDNFTESRPDSLLYDESELSVLAQPENAAETSIIQSGEFAIADPSAEVVFRHQDTQNSGNLTAAESVAAQRMNGTVKIISYGTSTQGTRTEVTSVSEGSGFVVTSDGYIVTNLHVINKNTSQNKENGNSANYTVDVSGTYNYAIFDNVKNDGKYVLFELEIVSYDQKEDMAVLKLVNTFSYYIAAGQKVSGLENVCTIDAGTVQQGEQVVTIGNALGYGLSVTEGIVSVAQMSGYYSDYGHNFIQTDCPINSGNSGGPMFNSEGNVIGINSMGLSESLVAYENISWAIPAASLTAFLDETNSGSVADGVVFTNADIRYDTV